MIEEISFLRGIRIPLTPVEATSSGQTEQWAFSPTWYPPSRPGRLNRRVSPREGRGKEAHGACLLRTPTGPSGSLTQPGEDVLTSSYLQTLFSRPPSPYEIPDVTQLNFFVSKFLCSFRKHSSNFKSALEMRKRIGQCQIVGSGSFGRENGRFIFKIFLSCRLL